MRKFKILYIVSTLADSGPINVLKNIILYLDRDLFEPIVLTLSPEPKNSSKAFFKDVLNARVISFNLSRLKGLTITKNDIYDIINKEQISLIHSHGFRADMITARVEHIPTLSTIHNHPFLDYAMSFGRIKGYFMALAHINFLKKIRYPISCSKNISKQLNLKCGLNLSYIQNGIDSKEYAPKDKSKDSTTFISVGGLTLRKDPLTIVKAFNMVKNRNYKLIFLGDGPLKQRCIDEAQMGGGNIEFLGFKDDVLSIVRCADYFVSSSLAEGLPNSVLEAMSCGIPCILSDIPSHNEFYENKENKFIFEIKQYSQLAKFMCEIQEYDYKELSKEHLDIFNSNFTAKIMSIRYQDFYKRVLIDKL